ncbi:serine hydrolase domain-containing protein [Gemmatimonadota bacterium Y43]|uniref:serine hydrolase domain-containing protein n=1 Tax=Gaopeijia maritima TaxID=3119007 RepID=UPI003277A173
MSVRIPTGGPRFAALIALVGLALSAPLGAQVADSTAQAATDLADELDTVVQADLEGTVGTGMVAGLVVAGELDFLQAWGFDAEGGDSLQVTATFAYPGLTEVLVAMTIRALGAGGMVDPTAPLADLVGGVSDGLGRVTLDQLLTHTSGLADDLLPEGAEGDAHLWALDADDFVAAPGEVYSVSRYSYPLAVRVLERVLNMPFPAIATQAVLTPLGMAGSTFDPAVAQQRDLATGYITTQAGRTAAEPVASLQGLPVLYTSTPDVLQLLAAWMSGGIRGSDPLVAGAEEAARIDPSRRLGDGVVVDVEALVPQAWITRFDAGFGTTIHMYPASEAALFVMSNGPLPRNSVLWIRQRVAEAVGDVETTMATEGVPVFRSTEPTRMPTGLDDLDEWHGLYRNGPIQLGLRLVDGQLWYFDGRTDLPLQGVGPATFAYVSQGAAVPLQLVEADGERLVLFAGKAYRWETAEIPAAGG